MPTVDRIPAGAPCWTDLMTSDVDRSRAFYTELFGWVAEDPNEAFGGYFNFTKDGVRVAGCMAAQSPDAPDVWSVYLAADDAAKTSEAVASHGGQVMIAADSVGDLGKMALFVDAAGAFSGAWQPGAHKGFGLYGEHGTPSWFDLLARDYEAALQFYRDVFGWETTVMGDSPEFRYSTMVVDGDAKAGVMDASGFLPDGVPSHWQVYFGVDDADAALARAEELGGTILENAEDTEFGQIGTAADPTGARFKVVAPNEAMPARD